ncbi:GGDEF domain-containing protein [Ahrensia sp. R2A130]|uniref:GGDEF domain-containing protein n=1 Tax=Ahrensia sp. R2A130 TaxID=744979 RepID=UPI0001E08C61|nr:GGDEF domain-containing protein [Ahrensia sp. R2A130]EFL88523.1 diguanylate cyclase [Ahrensia sp. R2A130]
MQFAQNSDRIPKNDNTNDSLSREVEQLREQLKVSEIFDPVTGLPNRAQFLERYGAEFRRAVRFDHALSVVMIRIRGYDHLLANRGEEAVEKVMCSLATMCEAASRTGIDIPARYDIAELAVVLPETPLAHALLFTDRLRDLVSRTPITLDSGMVRLGVRMAADTIIPDDKGPQDSIARARRTL